MRWLVIVLAIGCSSKSEPRVGSASGSAEAPAPPATGPGMRALPTPLPPGPYVVRYHCDLGDEAAHSIEHTIDLAAHTLTSIDLQPPAVVKRLDDAAVAQLQGAVDKLVHGGPYRAEPPDPEGTACYLAIGTSPSATFFQIDKSLTNEADAVSELVALIHRTANLGG